MFDDFDIYNHSDNSCGRAIMRSIEVTPTDNNLDLNFPLVNGKPSSIAGIEILVAGSDDSQKASRVSGNESRGYSGDGGPATQAQMNDPRGLVHDAAGNLYIADSENNVVRRVDSETGIITTVAGTGIAGFSGDGIAATDSNLNWPIDLKIGPDGNLYIADALNQRIRCLDLDTGIITTVAGKGETGFSGDNGPATEATFFNPFSIDFDTAGNLYLTDTNNNRIRKVDAVTGIITTIAGTGTTGTTGDNGLAINATMTSPSNIAIDANNHLFFTDSQEHRVRRIDANTGIITTVAGTGSASSGGDGGLAINAQIFVPIGLTIDSEGVLYIAESAGNTIRRVDPFTGIITTMQDAPLFVDSPVSMTTVGQNLYFSNFVNNAVYKVDYEGLDGETILEVSTTAIDFGEVAEGLTSPPETITLTNNNTASITVTSVTLSGLDAIDFTHDFSTPLTIAGNTSSTFSTTFAPYPSDLPPPPPNFSTGELLYRVNAGGGAIEDWDEDTEDTTSPYLIAETASIETTNATPVLDDSVPEGTPLELFTSKRRDANQPLPHMEWAFPVSPGVEYEIRLYFAELSRCSVGNRIFDVDIEGSTVLDNLDVFQEAGEACDVGIMRSVLFTPADDTLNITFPLVNQKPSIVSGIEIFGPGASTTSPRSAQLLIEHTGSNGTLVIALAGEAVASGGTTNQPPQAAFTWSAADQSITFTDTSTDADGTITSWLWDFGDGTTTTEQNPAHTYLNAGTYTVSLTVTDNEGATHLSVASVEVGAQDIVVSMPDAIMDIALPQQLLIAVTDVAAQAITAYSFTLSYDPAILTITGVDTTGTITPTIPAVNTLTPGEITVAWASIEDLTGSGPLLYLDVELLTAGTSDLTFSSFVFNEGIPSVSTEGGSIEVVQGASDGPFLEVNGLVSIEAEHAHQNTSGNENSWIEEVAFAGFSGTSYMVTTPDTGVQYKKDQLDQSPELMYDVEFSTPGSYYLWGRVWSPKSKSHSFHNGINGIVPPEVAVSGLSSDVYGSWAWVQLIHKTVKQAYEITTAGSHTLHTWMREDGTAIDKIVLTTDPDFIPEGDGPPESPRGVNITENDRLTTDNLALDNIHNDKPVAFQLAQNYPNPFNPTTSIRFDLPEPTQVRLDVYDMMGRRVTTLIDGQYAAGKHEATWDARADSGSPVASGIYLYRLRAGSFEAVGRMLLMK